MNSIISVEMNLKQKKKEKKRRKEGRKEEGKKRREGKKNTPGRLGPFVPHVYISEKSILILKT